MTDRPNIQRQDEISRQRGYGEQPAKTANRRDDEDPTQDEPGFRRDATPAKATGDRGAFRNDGDVPPKKTDEETLDRSVDYVTDPEGDPRTNNKPDTFNADKGDMSTDPTGDDADPNYEDPRAPMKEGYANKPVDGTKRG